MADSPEFLVALEVFSDSEFIIDELMVDDDDIIVLSTIGRCYMRRNLNGIYNFMEITVPCYLPDEFKSHFRMTRETCELFAQEAMWTGRIPLGNTSGRPAIPPVKQVLAFLWNMGNQETAWAVADRFSITMSSVNRILIRLSQAVVDLFQDIASNGQTVSNRFKITNYTYWKFYIFTLKYLFYRGGAVASRLVRSTPERAVQVRALAGDIVLCS